MFCDTFKTIEACTPNSTLGPTATSLSDIVKAYSSKDVSLWPSVEQEKWLKQVEQFENRWVKFQVNGLSSHFFTTK
jgi:hypothetical protein